MFRKRQCLPRFDSEYRRDTGKNSFEDFDTPTVDYVRWLEDLVEKMNLDLSGFNVESYLENKIRGKL